MKPGLFFAIPDGPLKAHMFTKEWCKKLETIVDVEWNDTGRNLSTQELSEHARDKELLITGWGSPKLTEDFFKAVSSLKMIAHCAGTVRWLVDSSFFDRDIVLTNANLALAPSVAEYCLMTMLMTRWQLPATIERVQNGLWQTNDDVVPGLNGAKIGLIGYGAITKELIRLLRSFDVEILVCSDHCTSEDAYQAGFSLCSLDDALRCDIVSLHRTLTEETRNMLGAKELAQIPDGGILINTARGPLVDEQALIHELRSGRIHAVLDVFDQEPLPTEHPLRRLPGALVTPHSAGTSVYMRKKMADLVYDDLCLFLQGKCPKGFIDKNKYLSMTPL